MKPDLTQQAGYSRERFMRDMADELFRLTGRVHALANLLQFYISGERIAGNELGPRPAPFPTVQNEGVGIQGEDQRAQKSEADPTTVSEAGTAKAGVCIADPRNSSRSSAEAQPLAGERTAPTKTEQALDLWAANELTEVEISKRVGCAVSSVRAFVYAARKRSDPRGFARSLAHDAKLSNPPTLSPAVAVLIPRKVEDREAPVSGFSKPAPSIPFTPADSVQLIGIGNRPDANITDFKIVGIDPAGRIIRGPLNDWTTDAPTMRTIRRMNQEGLFDKGTLIDAGPWPGQSAFEARIPMIKRHLAAIGIEFLDLKGAGCRIRRVGE